MNVWNTYFITFSTYGTRLHGDVRGSVDRFHNRPGDPLIAPRKSWVRESRSVMTQEPYVLDGQRRSIVLAAICQHAGHRGWELLAAHVRTNHVHVVVSADVPPERVMTEFKAYASRLLTQSGLESAERTRWTRHGSTRWLLEPEAVDEKIHYTLFEQGEMMSVFAVPMETSPFGGEPRLGDEPRPPGSGAGITPLPGGRGSRIRGSKGVV